MKKKPGPMELRDLPPEGLWISPEGSKWIPVVEHLAAIAMYPHYFGLTRADVEGADLPELRVLADGLIREGWTRFRVLADSFNFEVDSARRRMRLVEDVLTQVGAIQEDAVVISQASPRREFEGTVADVYDRIILRFQENNPKLNRWRFT